MTEQSISTSSRGVLPKSSSVWQNKRGRVPSIVPLRHRPRRLRDAKGAPDFMELGGTSVLGDLDLLQNLAENSLPVQALPREGEGGTHTHV